MIVCVETVEWRKWQRKSRENERLRASVCERVSTVARRVGGCGNKREIETYHRVSTCEHAGAVCSVCVYVCVCSVCMCVQCVRVCVQYVRTV